MKRLSAFTAAVLFPFIIYSQVPQLIANITAGNGNTQFGQHIVYNHQLIFEVSPGQLWITDGSMGGTQLIKAFPDYTEPREFVTCNGKVYFVGDDSVHGKELWVTDGTTNGTQMIKDIYPGQYGSIYGNLAVMNNNIYFAADDSTHGTELWVSDGSAAGTHIIKDVNPTGSANGVGDNITVIANKIIFPGNDGQHGMEPWSSDGTAGGTQMLADLDSQTGDTSLINGFATAGNKAYFSERMNISANHPPYVKLCVSDGSPGGTHALVTNTENTDNEIVDLNGVAYFNAVSYNANFIPTHRAIWYSDGTMSGTQVLKDSIQANDLTVFNNKLYFGSEGNHTPASYANELWTSDGTYPGTVSMKEFSSPQIVNNCKIPGNFVSAHNRLFFKAWDSTSGHINLWLSDGTTNGTYYVNYPGASCSNFNLCSEIPAIMAVVDSNIFFSMEYDTVNTGFELYKIPVTVGIPTVNKPDNDVEVYPNPVKHQLTVSREQGIAAIRVLNTQGQVIITKKQQTCKVQVDIGALNSGLYFVEVIDADGRQVLRRFIKE